jgi:glycosyltransferase involved in cell wall biosynthesis
MVVGEYLPERCGISDHVHQLAVELAKQGHDLFILSSPAGGEGSIGSSHDGIPVFREVPRWDFSSARSVVERIQRSQIEVVHLHYQPNLYQHHPQITFLPWLLHRHSARPRVKVVVTLHELAGPLFPLLPGPMRRVWLLPIVLFSDAVIVTNERDLSMLNRIPGFRRRLRYIPFGPTVDAMEMNKQDKQAVRWRLGIADDEVLLMRFGLIHNLQLGFIPELLQALKHLCMKGHRVKLLLVGGGNDESRAELTSMARNLGIEGRILMTGHCSPPEISGYLSSADIAIQLYPEGVCEKRTGLLTALLHGLPVVGLGNRHVASLFINRENIMLTFSSSLNDIAATIEELIADRNLRGTVSKNALGVAARFNWALIGKQIDNLYGSLIAHC